ncbi:MauE/DoxX family redox-associated membrane protein [Pedosphaera parvula]|uniref:DoxX family protein n=1 Tax=Pedosphaera parvula (strain Ellin514) TaxID=320771 RepID=B9XLX5_PEDPL|nr:MauE/DoxX family redox-associated membrane protein [Pedosphaera parvula]EEF59103.1 DoxX family protein [Pedosphaera parvula Ellin514]
MKTDSGARCCDARTAAVALGRWCLGIVFLFYGLGKFMGGVNGFAQGMVKQFEKTMLPPGLVTAFSYALPFLEVGLGVLLILGLARDVVLFIAGLLLIALTFGQVMLQQPQVVFFNTAYTMIAAVLLFASKYDRWVLMPGCCRWRGDGAETKTGN